VTLEEAVSLLVLGFDSMAKEGYPEQVLTWLVAARWHGRMVDSLKLRGAQPPRGSACSRSTSWDSQVVKSRKEFWYEKSILPPIHSYRRPLPPFPFARERCAAWGLLRNLYGVVGLGYMTCEGLMHRVTQPKESRNLCALLTLVCSYSRSKSGSLIGQRIQSVGRWLGLGLQVSVNSVTQRETPEPRGLASHPSGMIPANPVNLVLSLIPSSMMWRRVKQVREIGNSNPHSFCTRGLEWLGISVTSTRGLTCVI